MSSKTIALFGSFAMALLTIAAFMFTNFETKADSLDKRDSLEKRLDRIEASIDRMEHKVDLLRSQMRR